MKIPCALLFAAIVTLVLGSGRSGERSPLAEAGSLVSIQVPRFEDRAAAVGSSDVVPASSASAGERPLHGAPPWEKTRRAIDAERRKLVNAPLAPG